MLNKSQPFNSALEAIKNKTPKGAPYTHEQWIEQGPDITVKSLFSAGVENVRFLERAQKLMIDYLSKSTESVIGPDGVERVALKVGSRADFVEQIRNLQLKEGMITLDDIRGDQNDISNIGSLSRLNLIFDTNIRQAYGYGRWKQSMNPVVLHAFPAARFVRNPGAETKRKRHATHENDVRLKTDKQYWADFQNDPLIGGFAVSWSPYGFNSYMGQQEVSRKEALKLGLINDKTKITPEEGSLIDRLKVNLDNTDPALVERLRRKIEKYKKLKNSISTNSSIGSPTDVSSKIKSDSSVPQAWDSAYLKDTLKSIDEVHTDGPLKPLKFFRTTDPNATEKASYTIVNGLEKVALNKIDTPQVSIAHEIGHWLDDMAFNTGVKNITLHSFRGKSQKQRFSIIAKTFGSYSSEFTGLMKSIKLSKSYSFILNDNRLKSQTKEYLLSNHELLARAYAQWIAIKSKNPRMMKQIKSTLAKTSRGEITAHQWEDNDFNDISDKLDEIFRNRGWLNE